MSVSATSHNAAGLAASFAPASTSGAALDAVRFKTVTSKPALRRFFTMGVPMLPRPIHPIFLVIQTVLFYWPLRPFSAVSLMLRIIFFFRILRLLKIQYDTI